VGSTWLPANVPGVTSGVIGSPLPLRPWLAPAPEVFATSGVRKDGLFPERPTRPSVPLQSTAIQEPSWSRLFAVRAGLSPLRFSSPSASSRRWAATYTPGVPRPGLRYLLSVSRALEVLIRPSPAGPVSCRSRSWGLCLSRPSFPRAEPCALSSAVPLLLLLHVLESGSVDPASGSCSTARVVSRPAPTGSDCDLPRLSASLRFSPGHPRVA